MRPDRRHASLSLPVCLPACPCLQVPEHYEHLVVVNSINLTLLASQNPTAGMDILLRNMFDQEHKMCDKDEGGCGYSNVSATVVWHLAAVDSY